MDIARFFIPIIAGKKAESPTLYTTSGTYTGDGSIQLITTTFEPEIVIIAPENADAILWRDRTSWFCRSQHIDAVVSENAIYSPSGTKYNPFSGVGFRVEGDANKNAVVYHWVAIPKGILQITDWFGNALADRVLNWTTGIADAVMVKRDSARAAQWKINGLANTISSTLKG